MQMGNILQDRNIFEFFRVLLQFLGIPIMNNTSFQP